jgi:hypothetical protein
LTRARCGTCCRGDSARTQDAGSPRASRRTVRSLQVPAPEFTKVHTPGGSFFAVDGSAGDDLRRRCGRGGQSASHGKTRPAAPAAWAASPAAPGRV